jgi:type III protein arginine methyltransferase
MSYNPSPRLLDVYAFAMTDVPLDALTARAAEKPLGLARLAGVLFNMGDKARAHAVALQAIGAAPDDPEIRSLTTDVLSNGVPRWHFSIVRDEARNAAYGAALKRAVTPQTKVLEIGTGSGILAMMAARAGAEHVITCETMPAVAAAAQDIVARNGFTDRVRVIAKKSYDLDPEGDMGGQADLLVSEIISNNMFSQDVLPVTEHAAKTLLRRGAKIIPARGIVRLALAYDTELAGLRMDMIEGFDLSPFNRLAPGSHLISRGSGRLTLVSAPVDLFDFDFQSGGPFPASTASANLISTGGRANGIAQWIALQMDEERWYENNPVPGASSSAWDVLFWPFITARDCAAGTAVTVWGSHNRHRLRVWA